MNLTRRRFLTITASTVAAPFFATLASEPAVRLAWRGVALGANASITLSGHDTGKMVALIKDLEAEVSRLENIFSIYRDASEVSRLNRNGFLSAPAPEMLQLMSLTSSVHEATNGVFDPTVQSLWRLHADGHAKGEEPSVSALRDARDRTNWQRVEFSSDMVRFGRRGMALTFNGIAQGFIADRASDLLRANGFANVLVDMGEISALGHRTAIEPWHVGIARPDGAVVNTVDLSDRALATSAPAVAGLDTRGVKPNHIIDPRSGLPGGRWNLVSVSDEHAAVADALSTAFCLMDRGEMDAALGLFQGARIEHIS